MSDTPVILSVSPALHQRLAKLHEITGITSQEELLTTMAKAFSFLACKYPNTPPEILLSVQEESVDYFLWGSQVADRGNTTAEVELVSMEPDGSGIFDIIEGHFPPSLELIRNNAIGEARRKRIMASVANFAPPAS